MQLEVGKIYEGKVTGITKFGAFVELDKDTTGMVHISEVANTFVSEIKDHLQEGQTVKVKVLSMGDDGKISLSIKKALPAPPRKQGDRGGDRGARQGGGMNRGGDRGARQGGGMNRGGDRGARQGGKPSQGGYRPRRDDRPPQDFSKNPPPIYDPNQNSGNADFEDMLSKFKASSDEKFSDLKKITDNKRRSPSRRK